MIQVTSEQDKKKLRQHAFDLLEKENYEGLVILVEVLNETNFDIRHKDKALNWATENNKLDILKYLVEQGADIHAQDEYAFRWAAHDGHLEVVKYLVEQGADIHAVNNCALDWSAAGGHLGVIKYLVEQGADIHKIEDITLDLVRENGHPEVAEYLEGVLKNDSSH